MSKFTHGFPNYMCNKIMKIKFKQCQQFHQVAFVVKSQSNLYLTVTQIDLKQGEFLILLQSFALTINLLWILDILKVILFYYHCCVISVHVYSCGVETKNTFINKQVKEKKIVHFSPHFLVKLLFVWTLCCSAPSCIDVLDLFII